MVSAPASVRHWLKASRRRPDLPGKAHLSASEDSPLHGGGCRQLAAPLAVAGGQLLWEGVVTGGTASPATGSSSETASLSTEGNAAVLSLHY